MVVEDFMFYMSSNTRLSLTPGQKSQLQVKRLSGNIAGNLTPKKPAFLTACT
jgi:hypothetical protein